MTPTITPVTSSKILLMDERVKRDSSPVQPVHLTTSKRLQEWEFMDIVSEKSPMQLRETVMSKSAGNWTDFAQDINAIVLFATGFQDLITPRVSEKRELCHAWNRVPRKRDFLTTTVPMLETIYEHAGSKQNRKYLTSTHLQWHRGETLFGDCEKNMNSKCACDRVQQILRESPTTFGRIVPPPGPLPARGAVIFGQSKHPFKQKYICEENEKTPTLCTPENGSLTIDSRSSRKKALEWIVTWLGQKGVKTRHTISPTQNLVEETKVA
ncbi:hypothetical protein ACEPPN_006201 [Leptodophora sp. 'Broadleaf-Isolate-01']